MSNIKLFESKQIRSAFNEADQKWYFSVQDVVEVLTDTVDAKDYIKKMKKRDSSLNTNWGTNCPLVEMIAAGRKRKVQSAEAQGMLRLIQSIPSIKAGPFKLWLAQVGYERLEEIENPELATHRSRDLYKQKGYPDDWIKKRMRSIAIREELTDEWKNHEVKEQKEYAILTSEISKATFGLIPSKHKKLKRLKTENLRDHMTDLELIFSMLGEASTTAIVKTKNPKGFIENKKTAKEGGAIAGNARKAPEIKTGEKVVNDKNYLPPPKKLRKLK